MSYNYTFRDENDLWEAEYKVDATRTFYTNERGALDVDTWADEALIVAYKGKVQELASVRHVIISYESAHSGGRHETTYEEGEHLNSKVIKLLSGGSGFPEEEDVIKVTIQMDDDIQTLELTTDKHKFETY